MSGQIVGIGIEMKFEPDTGIAEVLSIIPGTPAQKEGLKAGDQILRINGKSYKGQNMRDVVYAIRGMSGEKVSLTILRGDKILTRSIPRESVHWNSVDYSLLPSSTGLIAIRYFSETTPNLLREALSELLKKDVKGLVIDLRNNEGGLFEKAIESIELFLPEGRPIVKVIKRGNAEEIISSRRKPMISGLLVTVLTNETTSCGAEIMASALRENLGAPIVGHKTFGKLNAQTLEELPNKYAFKFTSSIFQTPSGKTLDGVGLEPDFSVDLAEGKKLDSVQRIKEIEKRLSEDQPLRTALSIIEMKRNEKF
jgi:carboxyl-terminal processing protease